MSKEYLYSQLAEMVKQYDAIKAKELKIITDFADKHGLVASVYDPSIECQSYYVPNVDFDKIVWEDDCDKDMIERLRREYGEVNFEKFKRGDWASSSEFC